MSDPLRKVQPGQKVQIPASAYNAFIDAAIAQRGRQHDVEVDASLLARSSTIIKVRNQTGQAQSRFSILALDSPIVTPAGNLQQFQSQVAFDAILPANPLTSKRYAILAEPLAAGAIGNAVIFGATPVMIGVANVNHQYASPFNALSQYLLSADSGLFRILWKESGVGIKWAVVIAEPTAPAVAAVVFELTAVLSPGVSQTAAAQIVASSSPTEYGVGTSIVVFNTGQMKGRVGARGVAILLDGLWWVVDLNQPTIPARFLFTGNTHSPGSGDAFGDAGSQITIAYSNFTSISPYPFSGIPSAPIANPSNLIAFVGDSGLCVWDTATEQYILISVYPQRVRRFYFKLSSDWPNGLEQTSNAATAQFPDPTNHGGDLNYSTGTITLKDRWNLASNAKANDIGWCQLNYTTGQFDILEVSHVCRIGRAKISTDFSGKPSTFSVTDVQGFDGRAPVGTLLTVHNELDIESGKADDQVEIRWNPIQGRYYALPTSGGKGKVFPVLLEQTGGSQGTSTAPASWSYTVRDEETNDIIASNVNPVNAPHRWKRPSVGQMIKATFGYAHYSSSGSPQLVVGWINEVAEQQACEADGGGPGPPVVQDFPTPANPAIDFQSALLEQ